MRAVLGTMSYERFRAKYTDELAKQAGKTDDRPRPPPTWDRVPPERYDRQP
jgi:hypothetical protein